MSLKFPSTPGNDVEILEQVITMKESNSCEKTLKEKSKESQLLVIILFSLIKKEKDLSFNQLSKKTLKKEKKKERKTCMLYFNFF